LEEPDASEPHSHFAAVIASREPERIAGAISPAVVREHLRSAVPGAVRCWNQAAFVGAAGARGRLQIVIGADGRVVTVEADVGGAEDGAVFAECLEGVYGALRFPPLPGGGTVTVTYPLVFETAPEP
jgi:hypothetical protein